MGNKALIAFLFGNHLPLERDGHLYTLNETGKVSGCLRHLRLRLLAAVSGKTIKYAAKTIPVKGRRWPYYL